MRRPVSTWPLRQRLGPAAVRLTPFLAGSVVLLTLGWTSLSVGPTRYTWATVFDALFAPDPDSIAHVIIHTTRLSRTVIAMVVGAGLAVAGALMQALTRNPLASPGLFGVNAGAMFFLVAAAAITPIVSSQHALWIAFAGAAVAGGLVYALGTSPRARVFSLRIVLAGAAVTALFVSFSQALLVIHQEGLDSILFWLAGSTSERDLAMIAPVLPYMGIALAAALLLARQVDILAAGDDIAVGLGQRTGLIKIAVAVAVVCLAGGAVAMAGSIGFVGLIVPHMARRIVGAAHRRLLPACALFGACLLLAADVLSRWVIAPQELPVGAITALVGAPVFISMVRRGRHHAH